MAVIIQNIDLFSKYFKIFIRNISVVVQSTKIIHKDNSSTILKYFELTTKEFETLKILYKIKNKPIFWYDLNMHTEDYT